MADNPKISGYVVVGDWNASGVYQGGQGASVVNYALVTWQAVAPRRGIPPGTISGEWLRVPTKVQQTAPFIPSPPPPPLQQKSIAVDGPIFTVPGAPDGHVSQSLSIADFYPSITTASGVNIRGRRGTVPAPPLPPGTTKFLREDGTWAVAGGGGGGTVTSVALSAPAIFNVSGSPVIASGTLALALANQSANVAFMGPASGGAAAPTFRAIVPADLAGTPAAGKYWDGAGSGAWTALPAPGTGTVTSVGLSTDASYLTIGSTPVTTSGTITANKTTGLTANQVVATPNGAPGTADLRSLVAADLPNTAVTPGSYTYSAITVDQQGRLTAASNGAAPTGTVTSVALAAPTEMSVSGSPITTAGTITLAWVSEGQNRIFAGPTSGAGTPTFRALAAGDIPPLSYVTSVALTVPSIFSISGSPITSSGTLAVTLANESANLVFSGPTTGAATTPTFRAIVPADLAGTPGAGKYWDGAGSGAWTTLPAPGTGTVTSVALTAPTEITVGGSPITTNGTLALSWTNESANKVFAGPTSGGASTPAFRSLVAADLPNTAVTPGSYTYSAITVDAQGRLTSASSGAAPTGTVTSVALSLPADLTVSGSPVTTSGTLTAVWANESAHAFHVGPSSGGAAAPTWRSVVAADLGSGTANSTTVLCGDLAFRTIVAVGAVGVGQGPYASLPGSGVNSGDIYQSTDGPYNFVWTGSVWQTYLKGQAVTLPGLSSGWTQVNFGAAKVTLTDVTGMIGMKIVDTSAINNRLLTKNQPSTPYHVEFFLKATVLNINSTTVAVYFYDGTKLMSIECLGQGAATVLRVVKWTNVTTSSSVAFATAAGFLGGGEFGGIWLRLGNTGANLTFDWALERGDWQQLFTEAIGTFITPTQYGFGGICATTTAANFVYLSMQGITLTA